MFSEKELEKIIFKTPNEELRKVGLPIYGIKKRQLSIGHYGRADIVTLNRDFLNYLSITVIELKAGAISTDALIQGVKYVKGIKQYFKFRNDNTPIDFTIYLIGDGIERDSNLIYLPDVINKFRFFKYNVEFNGVHFEEIRNYVLLDSGFKIKKEGVK